MPPFRGEVSPAGFEEAKRRYEMPEAESIDEIAAAETEKRRRRWATELGLPVDTPFEEIKRIMRERRRPNDTDIEAA